MARALAQPQPHLVPGLSGRDLEREHPRGVDLGGGAEQHLGGLRRAELLADRRSPPLLAAVAVDAEEQVPGRLGRARELPLEADVPAGAGARHLRLVEPEPRHELLVPLDGAARGSRLRPGQDVAQTGEAHLPTGREARRAPEVVEVLGEDEDGPLAFGAELEVDAVAAPGEREVPGRVHLQHRTGGALALEAAEADPPARLQLELGLRGEPLREALRCGHRAPHPVDRVVVAAFDPDGRTLPVGEQSGIGHRFSSSSRMVSSRSPSRSSRSSHIQR